MKDRDAEWEELKVLRWGAGTDRGIDGRVIPIDWRSEVAAWPIVRWVRWRRMVAERLREIDGDASAEVIRKIEREAYERIKAELDRG